MPSYGPLTWFFSKWNFAMRRFQNYFLVFSLDPPLYRLFESLCWSYSVVLRGFGHLWTTFVLELDIHLDFSVCFGGCGWTCSWPELSSCFALCVFVCCVWLLWSCVCLTVVVWCCHFGLLKLKGKRNHIGTAKSLLWTGSLCLLMFLFRSFS